MLPEPERLRGQSQFILDGEETTAPRDEAEELQAELFPSCYSRLFPRHLLGNGTLRVTPNPADGLHYPKVANKTLILFLVSA